VSAVDAVVVTVPAGRQFLGVVNLVLGGLCTRLDFPYEQVDDLQLAVDSVLTPERASASAVTLEADALDGVLRVRIGPLARGTAAQPGLQRVLRPLVGAAEGLERDGAEWLAFEVARRGNGAKAG
jgi:hypothetical protein